MICLFFLPLLFSFSGLSTLSATRWKASLCYMWNSQKPLDLSDLWFCRMWKVIDMGFRRFIFFRSPWSRKHDIFIDLAFVWYVQLTEVICLYRYEKGHASGHWSDKHHLFSLDLEKQQIWDYVGDRYVHRLNQSKADGKSVAVNSCCSSVEECRTCGYGEDEGLDGALFSSKIEGVFLIHLW